MRESGHDYHPDALAEIESLAKSASAEMRQLVRVLLRRRRAVIDSNTMDVDAMAHTLSDGRVMHCFEQAGRQGGLAAFLHAKDDVFYLLSAASYEGGWNVEASEAAYFRALAAAVRRIDEI